MNRSTQCADILEYMRENDSISPLEALDELGCMRLAARINDLRKAGYKIESKRVSRKTASGKTVNYSRYRLAV